MLIDTERNTNAYRRMVDAIKSGSPFGFAGAGVAAGLGYPSWARLIDLLADEVQRVRGENVVDLYGRPLTLVDIRDIRNLLVRAEILKHNLAERYFEFMRETSGPIDRNVDSVADLVALPFRHLLTSNYDPSLERAIVSSGRTAHSFCLMPQEIADFVNRRREANYAQRVIHVHGKHDRPDTLVLTEADYARNYNAHDNYVYANKEDALWYSIPDVAASILATGRVPEILDAFLIEPCGVLFEAIPTKLRGIVEVDPEKDDFFRVIVEERLRLSSRRDQSDPETKRLEKSLKILASATCFGIYAQMDRQDEDNKVEVTCQGIDSESTTSEVNPPPSWGDLVSRKGF